MAHLQPAPPCQLDDLDRAILAALQVDGRRAFLDLARELRVSGGTIHQRLSRLREAGVVRGTTVQLDRRRLGLDVTVLVGVHLSSAKAVDPVLARLRTFPQVLRCFYTTGTYSLILEVAARSIAEFHDFLRTQLQSIDEIRATESFVVLDQPIERPVALPGGQDD